MRFSMSSGRRLLGQPMPMSQQATVARAATRLPWRCASGGCADIGFPDEFGARLARLCSVSARREAAVAHGSPGRYALTP